jgi:hypothetical protein
MPPTRSNQRRTRPDEGRSLRRAGADCAPPPPASSESAPPGGGTEPPECARSPRPRSNSGRARQVRVNSRSPSSLALPAPADRSSRSLQPITVAGVRANGYSPRWFAPQACPKDVRDRFTAWTPPCRAGTAWMCRPRPSGTGTASPRRQQTDPEPDRSPAPARRMREES